MSHTYAILEISESAWREIEAKLRDAGYHHVFHGDVIDMSGIAVKPETAQPIEGGSLEQNVSIDAGSDLASHE